MKFSTVARIMEIVDHPAKNAQHLDIIRIHYGTEGTDQSWIDLVTGKHYREGILGVWIAPGARIPGWLAEEGQFGTSNYFDIVAIEKKGVYSPGVFFGSEFRENENSPFWMWPHWKERWQVGQHLDDYFGIVATPEGLVLDDETFPC